MPADESDPDSCRARTSCFVPELNSSLRTVLPFFGGETGLVRSPAEQTVEYVERVGDSYLQHMV